MTEELKELKEHIRWLEDERRNAVAAEDCLNEIDGRLDEVNDRSRQLLDAYNGIAGAINKNIEKLNELVDRANLHSELLRKLIDVLAPKTPPTPFDTLAEFFASTNSKGRAAKPKPRKPKLSVVSKDGDGSPGGAS
jgi:hypothetical protein